MADTNPKPFKVSVSTSKLDWITKRVQSSLIIPDVQHAEGKEWDDGAPSATVEDLVDYWRDTYDWREVETKINSTFNMFTVDIAEGDEIINLHFVHHRSERPNAIPLLFAHGWPGNFTEVESLLSLTDPDDATQQPFHIVAPTIPGFIFSSSPKSTGFSILQVGSVYNKLMLKLGYNRYLGQGGDWGSMILRGIALSFPESCIGIHLNMVVALPPKPLQHPITLFWLALRWFTADEEKRVSRMQWWLKAENGFSRIQGTKPQTISYALLDSPVGMLAWIREKMEGLKDPGYVWDKELVVTWTILYLLSESSWHARIYKEAAPVLQKEVLGKKIPAKVAFGGSCFPYDVGYAPLWWAKVSLAENIVFWKEHAHGGHFPSVECPDELKKDIQGFVESLGKETRELLL